MKMEKKQCAKCNFFLLLREFKVSLRTGQLTKCCINCLDNCKKLRQQTKCKHGRQRSHRKDCGGSQICEHNKRRSRCKDCGGSQICEHNKRRSQCKDCGGSQVCEHNKIKSSSKDCGGSQICGHNKIKSQYKDCGGSQICERNKIKQAAKIVAEVKFVSITREDHNAEIVGKSNL